ARAEDAARAGDHDEAQRGVDAHVAASLEQCGDHLVSEGVAGGVVVEGPALGRVVASSEQLGGRHGRHATLCPPYRGSLLAIPMIFAMKPIITSSAPTSTEARRPSRYMRDTLISSV